MTGDIGAEFRLLSPERAEEGSRVHRLHQARRLEEEPSYQKEFFLKHEFVVDDIKVTVDGRADGVLPTQYIEEIKSTYQSIEALADYSNPLHWAQLKFYGFMYLQKVDEPQITLKLTYFNIDTEQVYQVDEVFTKKDLTDFVESVLAMYVGLKRLYFQWQTQRDHSIKVTEFPFLDYRPGQREMAVNVYGTIRNKKKMFVQAPTGIGKTISALFPAVKALREGKTDRIFYLTPKSTGKQIGEEAVDLMRTTGAKLRSLTLTSKEKICFMEEVRCEAEYCPYAKGYYDKVRGALTDLLNHEDSMSRAVVEQYARRHEICPFEFSLDLSLYADIIIGDYNYVFDPRVYLKRFFDQAYAIPAPDYRRHVALLLKEHPALSSRSHDCGLPLSRKDNPTAVDTIEILFNAFGLDLRSQKQLFRIAETAASAIDPVKPLYVMWLFFLAILIHKNQQYYSHLMRKDENRMPIKEIIASVIVQEKRLVHPLKNENGWTNLSTVLAKY